MPAAISASTVDYSIGLDLLNSPGLQTDSSGMVLLGIAATGNGAAQQNFDKAKVTRPVGPRPVKVSLFLSTDNQFSRDDVLLEQRPINLPVASSSGTRKQDLKISFNADGRALASGSYYVIARIDGPPGVEAGSDLANNQVSQLVNPKGADPILTWTSCALNAVKSAGSNGKPGIPPTTGTRLMALLTTAMLDTLAAFGDEVAPYRFDQNAPKGTHRDAALIGAAQRILSLELPGEMGLIQDQFNLSRQSLRGSQESIRKGLAFGASMADRILALRADDGSKTTAPYVPPSGSMPGYVWTPASSGPMENVAMGSHWGSVRPWVISSADAFRSDGLQSRPDVNLDLYAEQLNEVRLYGGLANTAKTTVLRTPDQTEMALFWAYDRPDTFRPYGHLLDIAMDVAVEQDNSLFANAELLSTLSLAMADVVICAWKEKYTEVQPRPWDLITGAMSDTDGSPLTVRDPQWRTLLSSINGIESPPFPDFLSGHSAMGGTFASVMTHFFGDKLTFAATSEEVPGVTRQFAGFKDQAGVKRNSFYQAGLEDALSRIYGGVHIREACLDSFDVGLNVGSAVVQSLWA
jgi:hypothetical protein